MKQSIFFNQIVKQAATDEVSVNAKFFIQGGYADKLMSGVYTILPLGLRVLKKIENIIREEVVAAGGQELLMPSLHPKENWVQTGRWDTVDDLFRFVSHYSKIELALGPTHEEVISPLVKKFNLSYKNLPLYLFQFQTKFRDEKRAKSGLLRGREFIMKDLYSFHSDEKDMDDYYEKMKVHYKNIFNRCGIGEKTYITYASGGSFSKYSHEYQTVTGAGEDLIYICDNCKTAVNKEIIGEHPPAGGACPQCGNKDLKEEKSVEVGNIFKLKDKFSQPFDLTYADKDGGKKPVVMGCYGIGLQRLMGAVAEVKSDGKSIVWPREIAPFKIHLIPLNLKLESVAEKTREIYESLSAVWKNEVLLDDRDLSAGEKFAEADFVGAPYRVIVSEKTLKQDSVEVQMKESGKTELVEIGKLVEFLS